MNIYSVNIFPIYLNWHVIKYLLSPSAFSHLFFKSQNNREFNQIALSNADGTQLLLPENYSSHYKHVFKFMQA